MSPRAGRWLLGWLVLVGAVAPASIGSVAVGLPADGAGIVGVFPNPGAPDDAGEWVGLAFPTATNVSGWTVDDGESAARLPNVTLSGHVLATTDPAAVRRRWPNATVVALSGHLALANAGETVRLRRGDGVVDAVTFRDAPEGEVYRRDDGGWAWRVPGRTHLVPVDARDVPARLFVLPDAPSVPIAAIDAADRRVLLAAYTYASPRATAALCAARERGATVRVLVEADPVGGFSHQSVTALDALVACGVEVAAIGGPGGRYLVHHPKYAVVDDRALVLSENWKPAGTGGRSSRGWGVLLNSSVEADALARLFAADAGFRDVRPWSAIRAGVVPEAVPAANGTYPTRFAPTSASVDRVELLVAPDDAEPGIVSLLDGAERSIEVQQVSIGSRHHPFVNATLRAARRGVAVSILLSSAWYVREDNRRLVEWFRTLAREEGLPIRARLIQPRSRFEKSHVKAVVVDGRAAVVGSLNWNAYATRRNREVVVVLYDRSAAAYYDRVFHADWNGGVWRLPAGLAVATALAAVAAAVRIGRSVRVEPAARAIDPGR